MLRFASVATLVLTLSACESADTQIPVKDAGSSSTPIVTRTTPIRVLLYTKETEWMHPSTPVAAKVMLERGRLRGWDVRESKESSELLKEDIGKTDVIFFLNSSGMTMNQAERDAFASYIAQGHGWVGAHAASHTDYDWPFMADLIGAIFCCHPPMAPGNLVVQDPSDPIVAHLPKTWAHTDEWYTYSRRPESNPKVKVLLTVDEHSIRPDYPGPGEYPGLAVGYHATTWTNRFGATRVFYTGLGHAPETWQDELFLTMLIKAVEWAAEAHAAAP